MKLTLFFPVTRTTEESIVQVCNITQRLNQQTKDQGTTVTVTFVHTRIVQATNETRMAETFTLGIQVELYSESKQQKDFQ